MRRRTLLATLPGTLTVGCLSRTGDPPPYPQPTFEYEAVRADGATVLNVTVVDGGGLTDEPVRILVGGTVAYANGSLRPPYRNGTAAGNEWADGIESGDSIRLTDGTTGAAVVEVEIQLRRPDTSEFVGVGGAELERPPLPNEGERTGTDTT